MEFCTGCGACASICPANAIEMVEDIRNGVYAPHITKSRCVHCDICMSVCPGYHVDFKELNKNIFNQDLLDDKIGCIYGSYLAYSTDNTIRIKGQSGGFISSFLIYCLKNGIIDGAIVTRMNKSNPLRPETFIATDPNDILEASKSKYCPVPAVNIIKDLIKVSGRFAFVGLPCHIHAIRKMQKINNDIDKKIILCIGLFCNKTLNFHFQQYLINNASINRESLRNFFYRDKETNGWPGEIRVVLKSGQIIVLPKEWRMQAKPLFTPLRCYLCFDQLNILADISVGDPWLPIQPIDIRTGISVVITRTEFSNRLVSEMEKETALNIAEISIYDIAKGQHLNERFIQAKSYIDAYNIIYNISPIYDTVHFLNLSLGKKTILAAMIDLFIIRTYSHIFRDKNLKFIPKPLFKIAALLRNILISYIR